VLSLYSLFHFPEPLAAVREMHRVLRPGGRVVIGVGSAPSLFSWNGIVESIRAASERVAAAHGRLLTAPRFLLQLMREHGMAPAQEHQPGGARAGVASNITTGGIQARPPVLARALRGAGSRRVLEPSVTYASAADRLQQACLRNSLRSSRTSSSAVEACGPRRGRLIYRHAAMFYAGTRALPLGNTGCSGGPRGWGARCGPSCPRKVATRSRCYHSRTS
jgi:hypothetical protein